jgi:hypothetical protein
VNDFRNEKFLAAFIRPSEYLRVFGDLGAQIMGARPDANPPEVEPVCVPAGLNRYISIRQAIGVIDAGCVKKVEFFSG